MVCAVVPQPESCGTDSGTGEIPVFARFSILLYQCTNVTVNIRGGSHPPSPHQATSIISSHTPFPPLVRRYVVQHSPSGPAKVACSVFGRHALLPSGTAVCGTGLMPPHRPGGSSTQLPHRSPLHALVQRYMVRHSGMSKIAGQPSTVRERQGTAPFSPAPRPRPPAPLQLPK